MTRPFQFLFMMLFIVGGVIGLTLFLRQNPDPVQLEFIRWRTRPISEGAVAVLSFLIGVGFSLFFVVSAVISKSVESARLRRENLALQKMIESYSSSSKK